MKKMLLLFLFIPIFAFSQVNYLSPLKIVPKIYSPSLSLDIEDPNRLTILGIKWLVDDNLDFFQTETPAYQNYACFMFPWVDRSSPGEIYTINVDLIIKTREYQDLHYRTRITFSIIPEPSNSKVIWVKDAVILNWDAITGKK